MAVGGLPVIAGVSCPPTAAALGTAGLGPVCQVVSGAKHVAGSAASSLVGFGANSVLNALGSWVSDGATWLLRQIGSVIGATTTIDLGASWFTTHYRIMVALAGVVIVPMLLLGIMQSIYRQNVSTLVRSVLVNVPLAILLTAVAVKLVQLGLSITDAMSAAIAQGAGLDSGHFLASVTVGLSVTSGGEPSAPAFVMFVGGLAVVFGALMVWVELLIRAAAVYVAVLFLPLALASLAWPAIAHWCRRLVDTLVALVLGKFVIVAVLSLAAGALAGGTQSLPGGGAAPERAGPEPGARAEVLQPCSAGRRCCCSRRSPPGHSFACCRSSRRERSDTSNPSATGPASASVPRPRAWLRWPCGRPPDRWPAAHRARWADCWAVRWPGPGRAAHARADPDRRARSDPPLSQAGSRPGAGARIRVRVGVDPRGPGPIPDPPRPRRPGWERRSRRVTASRRGLSTRSHRLAWPVRIPPDRLIPACRRFSPDRLIPACRRFSPTDRFSPDRPAPRVLPLGREGRTGWLRRAPRWEVPATSNRCRGSRVRCKPTPWAVTISACA